MEVKSPLICEPNIDLDYRQRDDWISNMHSYVLCQNGNELAIVVKRTVDHFVNYIIAKRYYILKIMVMFDVYYTRMCYCASSL